MNLNENSNGNAYAYAYGLENGNNGNDNAGGNNEFFLFILLSIISILGHNPNSPIDIGILNEIYNNVDFSNNLYKPRELTDYDAEADLYLDHNLFNKLFFISTNIFNDTNKGFDINIKKIDINFESIKKDYINNLFKDVYINPSLAIVKYHDQIDNQIDSSNCNIIKDFIRYLSLKLFGTAKAVDLFSNESELYNNLYNAGEDWNNTYVDKIYNNYIEISKQIYKYFITNKKVSIRFKDILDNQLSIYEIENVLKNRTAYDILDGLVFFPLPIEIDDVITFKITIYPDEKQHELTGVDEIKERIYKINLNLI